MPGGCAALQYIGVLYRCSVGVRYILGEVLIHPLDIFDVISLGCGVSGPGGVAHKVVDPSSVVGGSP